MRATGRPHGFTFIELLMTLAILGVLLLTAVPTAQWVVKRHKEGELKIALMQVREAIDAYKRAADGGRILMKGGESGYPPTLDELVDGVDDQRSPTRQKIYFLRRLPRDPFHPDPHAVAAKTWGIRSYASPPTHPSEGADVFDIYSRSEQTGLDGVPYRDW